MAESGHRGLLDLEVPDALIAQQPLAERDRSRLMLLRRGRPGCAHHEFRELPDLLPAGALLVRNNTRVVPARLTGRLPSGRACEVLLVAEAAPGLWRAMVKGARRVRPGDSIALADDALQAEARERDPEGYWLLAFPGQPQLRQALEAHGEAPLPPYIRRPPGREDRERYQTVYARIEGSIAAPTAGFHFTPAMFEALEARGFGLAEVTLHVGVGTFKPIQTADPAEHVMHAERYVIAPETCRNLLAAREAGRPVIAVGTTSVRALESWAAAGSPAGIETDTALYIHPPYPFRVVDGLITNFHQPASTLLQLVAAFHGEANVIAAYREAVAARYRFYSYGDCMAILPG